MERLPRPPSRAASSPPLACRLPSLRAPPYPASAGARPYPAATPTSWPRPASTGGTSSRSGPRESFSPALRATTRISIRPTETSTRPSWTTCGSCPKEESLSTAPTTQAPPRPPAKSSRERPDLVLVPYGVSAEGPFRLQGYQARDGSASFSLRASISISGSGSQDAISPSTRQRPWPSPFPSSGKRGGAGRQPALSPRREDLEKSRAAIAAFAGSKRSSEILGEAGGVLFMDDYGHHPTAIRETIRGIKEFWPERRLVVDFMSHTYSRTKALLRRLRRQPGSRPTPSSCTASTASARERPDPRYPAACSSSLAASRHGRAADGLYFEGVLEGADRIADSLRPGDLFLTMGAGDNWRLGEALSRTGYREEARDDQEHDGLRAPRHRAGQAFAQASSSNPTTIATSISRSPCLPTFHARAAASRLSSPSGSCMARSRPGFGSASSMRRSRRTPTSRRPKPCPRSSGKWPRLAASIRESP